MPLDPIPALLSLPVGLEVTGVREETDSLGPIEVPAGRYWGAQTQRSLAHFSIGDDRMPLAVYRSYGLVKKAAAVVNGRDGRLPEWKASLIARVADEVIAGAHDEEFPLFVWQTGSGTHTNMNVNEVISNRAIQLVGGVLGSRDPIHPNDDVNLGQSSNDTFPTVMHLATLEAIKENLVPGVMCLRDSIARKSVLWAHIVKVGRTHLQDATPLTVGQEWSGYVSQLDDALAHLDQTLPGIRELAIGGTAVGTGLNAPVGFGVAVAAELSRLTGEELRTATNPFTAQSSVDALVRVSGALRGIAVALFKFANDVRWSASGPRAGIGELVLPANEPGSSIMPGKVNPTQAEAVLMVCVQVLANDTAVALAGAEGNFQLNAFRPLVIRSVLHSIRLLGSASEHLARLLVDGAEVDEGNVREHLARSVMLVTALTPVIGYDQAARIAHLAIAEDLTLRDAAIRCGVDGSTFDRVVDPARMTMPGAGG